jgi:FAS-associated factor 2
MTTQSEDESVATLAAIAGLEDLEHARRLLRQHGGDLEAAVNTAMGFSAPPDPSNAVGHPDPRDDGRRSAPGTRPRQRVRPLRPNPVVQLLNLPLGIVKATVGIFVKVIGNVLVGLVGRNNAARITHAATGGELDDPIESASKFKRMMRKDFGDSLPDFLELSHAAALRVASEEGKMLFVYLHSPEHPDCRAFCRDVLSHPAVTDVVNNSCVAWGGDVTKTDAHRLASRLNPSTFPYVALMTSAGGGSGVLALAIEGAVEPGDLARLLAETAETHGVEMLGERMEREERETERRIRDEQDAAYRAALEADAQREREAASRAAAEEEEAARARRGGGFSGGSSRRRRGGGSPSVRGEAKGGEVRGAGRGAARGCDGCLQGAGQVPRRVEAAEALLRRRRRGGSLHLGRHPGGAHGFALLAGVQLPTEGVLADGRRGRDSEGRRPVPAGDADVPPGRLMTGRVDTIDVRIL